MGNEATMGDSFQGFHLAEVGIIFLKDVHHLPFEAAKLIPKILELRLNDSLLRKLLMKKLPHLIGLERHLMDIYKPNVH